jgi:hypothetical protein
MKKAMAFATRLYACLINLYPSEFLDEFGDEMVSVFATVLLEAAGQGTFPLIRVCLRELWDIPGGVLCAHLNALKGVSNMQKWLHSQPVLLSARCGAGFGLSFLIFNILTPVLQPLFTDQNVGNTSLSSVLYTYALILLAGIVFCLIFGISMAFAFGDVRRPQRFLLLAAIWFVFPEILSFTIWVCVDQFRWINGEWFQSLASTQIFNIVFFAVTGAYLGVVINPWPKERWKMFQFMLTGAIGLLLARLVHLPSAMMVDWNPALKNGLYWAIVGLVIGALLGLLSSWSASRGNTEVVA